MQSADAPFNLPVVQPVTVRKRDGQTTQPFDVGKIESAVRKAWIEAEGAVDEEGLHRVATFVSATLRADVADVEQIQDAVEVALMRAKQFKVAKAFIIYRQKRTEARTVRRKPDASAVSDYIHASKYARYVPEIQRREVYDETVDRVEGMHLRRFAHIPELLPLIKRAHDLVREKKVLPSMRSMQFGGKAIEANHNRIYNCLSEDTAFITSTGVRRFSDFEHGDRVTVLTHAGNWKPAKVFSYGKQQLYKVELQRGSGTQTVRATRNHQWVLSGGERTRELQVGQVLARPPTIVGAWRYEDANPEERWYWAMGYVYGDGTCVKNREGQYTYSMVRLCGDDGRFVARFEELGFKISRPPSCNGDAMAYTGKYLKTLPTLETDGHANVAAFVRGYLDADGHKNANANKDETHLSPFDGIQTSNEAAISFIRTVFPTVGAYITRERDLTGQTTNYGTRPTTSMFGLTFNFGVAGPATYKVKSIEPDAEEVVWCLEVEDDHSFVLDNGVVTGNCSATLIDRPRAFAEAMFLLLSGCGVGYSVQFEHVDKLPPLADIDETLVVHHVIEDTIEGWAGALDALVNGYTRGYHVEFAYHQIRAAGAALKTSGGRAPGHRKLKLALERIRGVLHSAQGRKLRPIECHRVLCHAADAVLSGGIRRSAMICLFSLEDSELMYAKSDRDWYSKEPWLANANNSVVLKRDEVKEKQFKRIFGMTKNYGEPGVLFVSDYNHVTNPCAEIGLDPLLLNEDGTTSTGWAMCNLCEINAAKLTSYEDFSEAAWAAALIGTMQATYTDMPFLGKVTEAIVRRDALLGIGMTGMQDAPHIACNPDYQRAIAGKVVAWNAEYAAMIGINQAARTTCVKPSGTTSLELGNVGSGIHPHHARRYIRRVTADELEVVFQAFQTANPHMCVKKPDGKWVIEFPVEAPEGAVLKEDLTAEEFMNMVRSTQQHWVMPGATRPSHMPGLSHNVSNTISVRPTEWVTVADYLWDHRDNFTGVSLLPDSGDMVYAFAPFEAVKTEAQERRWNELIAGYKPIDYLSVFEAEDGTNLTGEAACANGACEWHA